MKRRDFLRFCGLSLLAAPSSWPKLLRGPREGDVFWLGGGLFRLVRAAATIRKNTVVAWLYSSVVPATSSERDIAGVAAEDANSGDVFPICVYGVCVVRVAT